MNTRRFSLFQKMYFVLSKSNVWHFNTTWTDCTNGKHYFSTRTTRTCWLLNLSVSAPNVEASRSWPPGLHHAVGNGTVICIHFLQIFDLTWARFCKLAIKAGIIVVCYTALFSVVTQRSSSQEEEEGRRRRRRGWALSDDTKNGCVAVLG